MGLTVRVQKPLRSRLARAEKRVAELQVAQEKVEASLAVMREALESIGGEESCGCMPLCRCNEAGALEIWKDEARAIAQEALASNAGKPYLEVVEAARKLDGEWNTEIPHAHYNAMNRATLVRAVRAAVAKLDNPADSPATGSPQSDANPKEESDHLEGGYRC